MKTALLTCIFVILIITTSISQIVSDVALKEINTEYINLYFGGFKTNKITVNLDFGQSHPAYDFKHRLIKDESGKPLEFNSMIEAFNLLDKFGYELIEVIPATTDMSSSDAFLMRRKKQ